MILAASLDDQDGSPVTLHRTATRRLTSATGLVGMGPLRNVTRPRPTGHGALNDTRYQDGQPISLEGLIAASSNDAAIADFHTIAGTALATLDYGAALLKWTEEGGLTLQRRVKLAGPLDPPLTPQPRSLAYQLQFLAEDPRAYSQTLQTVTSSLLSVSGGGHIFPTVYPRTYTASGGGLSTVVNAGNRKTPPIFKIYGYCVNPSIVNLTTSERMTIVGTIANGDYVEVGTDSSGGRYAKLNGTALVNNLVSPTLTTWFGLGKGTSNLQMIAGTFDGSAKFDTVFRSAYA